MWLREVDRWESVGWGPVRLIGCGHGLEGGGPYMFSVRVKAESTRASGSFDWILNAVLLGEIKR